MNAVHAAIRFGLGPRPGEIPPSDPRGWLAAQLDGPDPVLAQPGQTIAEAAAMLRRHRAEKSEPGKPDSQALWFRAASEEAIGNLLTTQVPFRERLVWFWLNHFTVSVRGGQVAAFAGSYLRDAIRPHVTGRFADMVLAVMRHPAMLTYLNNAESFGPDSIVGQRQHRGLNENLARECLELHTVTPAAGYSQADVTQFARVLTGWSIENNTAPEGFRFRPNGHAPGPKTVMGQTWPEGEEGGRQALAWLARHPATLRSIATKLVRHFVADTPPPGAVAAIEAVLRKTDGDLKAASLAVLDLKEAWTPLAKLRSPHDYVIAAVRALDLPQGNRPDMRGIMAALGQPPINAPGPNGWPDTAPDWAAPEAMLRRVDWAYAVAGRLPSADPLAIADVALGPLLPAATRAEIARAGSKREALTLLLAAPEFQRR